MKTSVIFFLVLGQAGGGIDQTPGGLATIPHEYVSLEACEAAGEEARMNNQGLSFLSYTCVHAERAIGAAARSVLAKSRTSAGTGEVK